MSICLTIFPRDACAAALRALCVMWYVDQMTPRFTINNNTKNSLCNSIKGWFFHNMTNAADESCFVYIQKGN